MSRFGHVRTEDFRERAAAVAPDDDATISGGDGVSMVIDVAVKQGGGGAGVNALTRSYALQWFQLYGELQLSSNVPRIDGTTAVKEDLTEEHFLIKCAKKAYLAKHEGADVESMPLKDICMGITADR